MPDDGPGPTSWARERRSRRKAVRASHPGRPRRPRKGSAATRPCYARRRKTVPAYHWQRRQSPQTLRLYMSCRLSRFPGTSCTGVPQGNTELLVHRPRMQTSGFRRRPAGLTCFNPLARGVCAHARACADVRIGILSTCVLICFFVCARMGGRPPGCVSQILEPLVPGSTTPYHSRRVHTLWL